MQNNATQSMTMQEIFGKPIHTYTRAQAIEDGVLVDFTALESDTGDVCRQHYKYPIAATAAVFRIMEKAVNNRRYCNDYAGILHDMLWMSKVVARKLDPSTVVFRCIIQGAGRSKYYDFKLQVHPGDHAEPVITIMLPGED
jgi:hypothetical protein